MSEVNIFAPLLGQLTWSGRRGHGSFLMLNFGKPHLAITEKCGTAKKPILRDVTCEGEWTLWVTYSDWKLSTTNGICTNEDEPIQIDRILNSLNGQNLTDTLFGKQNFKVSLFFDLGSKLEIWLPDEENNRGDEMWILFDNKNGVSSSYQSDGNLKKEECQKFLPGSIGLVNLRFK